ncbi:hypothetical protein P43SY_005525 [Pythium insidiosum]|uniref:Transmembrane protein n=1 Tax=Pythium insidiosum TaxID=114742 RepID=A0AAD5QBB0_PYTIN|nr:hypothetical protein P43SY_005525 [Pythium insidiosum]
MSQYLWGNGRGAAAATEDSAVDERSPLLRAIRTGSSSSYEGSYMAMPSSSSGHAHHDTHAANGGVFRPIIYAEKALASLLNGVLMYALCCIIGVLFVSLNFEGVLGEHINWWLVFLPFWVANVCLLLAHAVSLRHAQQLRKWAEIDSMSNEPLLPLLRRIVMVYAVSFPLTLLLLWSELAFCARLQDPGTSLYICYAPLMVIQVAFFIRYLLCRSDSTLPGICWILAFVFTLLVAYQTNNEHVVRMRRSDRIPIASEPADLNTTGPSDVEIPNRHELTFSLSWWTVTAPLFTLEGLLGVALGVVLYNEFAGIYRMTRWQLVASAIYLLALVAAVTGQLMLLEHVDYHWGTFTFPSALILLGLVAACVAMYIVGRHHVEELMASKGGAVPVPLTRTSQGWITSHAVSEHWILVGDIYLTADGLNARNQTARRRDSLTDLDAPTWKRVWRRLRKCCGREREPPEMLTPSDPERRIQNLIKRRTSGSYSDIKVEDIVDTPKSHL